MRARIVVPRYCALPLAILLSVLDPVGAETPRFALHGAGMLASGATVQGADPVRPQSHLMATAAVEPTRVANARYALTAMLSATSIACSADTVFRDSFDGSGL